MKKIVYGSILSAVLSMSGIDVGTMGCNCGINSNKKEEKNIKREGILPIREITAEELLQELNDPNIIIINVLGYKYYVDAHIKNSISAPLKNLEEIAQKQQWNKNKKIVVYCACRECDASYKAYWILKNMGYHNILAYEGGIREWWKKGYPTQGPAEQQYLREEGDNHHKKILAMRDGPLRQILLSAFWGLTA